MQAVSYWLRTADKAARALELRGRHCLAEPYFLQVVVRTDDLSVSVGCQVVLSCCAGEPFRLRTSHIIYTAKVVSVRRHPGYTYIDLAPKLADLACSFSAKAAVGTTITDCLYKMCQHASYHAKAIKLPQSPASCVIAIPYDEHTNDLDLLRQMCFEMGWVFIFPTVDSSSVVFYGDKDELQCSQSFKLKPLASGIYTADSGDSTRTLVWLSNLHAYSSLTVEALRLYDTSAWWDNLKRLDVASSTIAFQAQKKTHVNRCLNHLPSSRQLFPRAHITNTSLKNLAGRYLCAYKAYEQLLSAQTSGMPWVPGQRCFFPQYTGEAFPLKGWYRVLQTEFFTTNKIIKQRLSLQPMQAALVHWLPRPLVAPYMSFWQIGGLDQEQTNTIDTHGRYICRQKLRRPQQVGQATCLVQQRPQVPYSVPWSGRRCDTHCADLNTAASSAGGGGLASAMVKHQDLLRSMKHIADACGDSAGAEFSTQCVIPGSDSVQGGVGWHTPLEYNAKVIVQYMYGCLSAPVILNKIADNSLVDEPDVKGQATIASRDGASALLAKSTTLSGDSLCSAKSASSRDQKCRWHWGMVSYKSASFYLFDSVFCMSIRDLGAYFYVKENTQQQGRNSAANTACMELCAGKQSMLLLAKKNIAAQANRVLLQHKFLYMQTTSNFVVDSGGVFNLQAGHGLGVYAKKILQQDTKKNIHLYSKHEINFNFEKKMVLVCGGDMCVRATQLSVVGRSVSVVSRRGATIQLRIGATVIELQSGFIRLLGANIRCCGAMLYLGKVQRSAVAQMLPSMKKILPKVALEIIKQQHVYFECERLCWDKAAYHQRERACAEFYYRLDCGSKPRLKLEVLLYLQQVVRRDGRLIILSIKQLIRFNISLKKSAILSRAFFYYPLEHINWRHVISGLQLKEHPQAHFFLLFDLRLGAQIWRVKQSAALEWLIPCVLYSWQAGCALRQLLPWQLEIYQQPQPYVHAQAKQVWQLFFLRFASGRHCLLCLLASRYLVQIKHSPMPDLSVSARNKYVSTRPTEIDNTLQSWQHYECFQLAAQEDWSQIGPYIKLLIPFDPYAQRQVFAADVKRGGSGVARASEDRSSGGATQAMMQQSVQKDLELSLQVLAPPIIIRLQADDKASHTAIDRKKWFSKQQVRQIQSSGGKVTIFVHGFDVEFGSFACYQPVADSIESLHTVSQIAPEGDRHEAAASATTAKQCSAALSAPATSAASVAIEGLSPVAKTIYQPVPQPSVSENASNVLSPTAQNLVHELHATEVDMQSSGGDANHATGVDMQSSGGDANHATGAHAWGQQVEFYLNKAAGFSGDYRDYQRLIIISWPATAAFDQYGAVMLRAQQAGLVFATVLAELKQYAFDVSLIGHSLGCGLCCVALDQLYARYQLTIERLFLWQAALPNTILGQAVVPPKQQDGGVLEVALSDNLSATNQYKQDSEHTQCVFNMSLPYTAKRNAGSIFPWQTPHLWCAVKKITVLYSRHDNVLGPRDFKQLSKHKKQEILAAKPFWSERLTSKVLDYFGLGCLYRVGVAFGFPLHYLLLSENQERLYQMWRHGFLQKSQRQQLPAKFQYYLGQWNSAQSSIWSASYDKPDFGLRGLSVSSMDLAGVALEDEYQVLQRVQLLAEAAMAEGKSLDGATTSEVPKPATKVEDGFWHGVHLSCAESALRLADIVQSLKDLYQLYCLVSRYSREHLVPALGYAGPELDSAWVRQMLCESRLELIDESDCLWQHSAMKDPSVAMQAIYAKIAHQLPGFTHYNGKVEPTVVVDSDSSGG